MTNNHRKTNKRIGSDLVASSRTEIGGRRVFDVALGRSVRTVFDNLQFEDFRALTLILFVFALDCSAAIGWLDQNVEYYAGTRI